MSRRIRRVIAAVLMVVGAVIAYFLQPANLIVFRDPQAAAVFLGAAGVFVTVLTNVLPNVFAEDPPFPRG